MTRLRVTCSIATLFGSAVGLMIGMVFGGKPDDWFDIDAEFRLTPDEELEAVA